MVEVVTYSNSEPVTIRGNTYVVNGTTNVFALPFAILITDKENILLSRSGVVQSPNTFIYPSSTLSYMGINIDPAPAVSEVVEIRVFGSSLDISSNDENLVTLDEVKEYLKISPNKVEEDARLSNIIIYVSKTISAYCSRNLKAANVIYEYHNGGYPYVFVNNPPINEIYEIAEYSGTEYIPLTSPPSSGGLPNVAANSNSAPDFTVDSASGTIWKGIQTGISSSITNTQGFAKYSQGIRISYNGGYTSIPPDLKFCALQLVKDYHKGIDVKVLEFNSKDRLEKMPYSAGFPPHILRILNLYRIIL